MFSKIQAHRDLRRIVGQYTVELPSAEVQSAWISGNMYYLKWLNAHGLISSRTSFRPEYIVAGFLRASPRGMAIIVCSGVAEDYMVHWEAVSNMDVNAVRRAYRVFGVTLVHGLFPPGRDLFGPFDIRHLTRETFAWCLRKMAPAHIEPFLARACCGGTPIHVFVSALKWCRAQKRALSVTVYGDLLRWAIFKNSADVATWIIEHAAQNGATIAPLIVDGDVFHGGSCDCGPCFAGVAALERVMRTVGIDYASLIRARHFQPHNIRAWIDKAVAVGIRVV